MKKIALLLFSLALSGTVIAQTKIMNDVNSSCGYDVFTDCTGCHYDPEPTYEKTTYLTEGACGLCTEVTSCTSAPPTEAELYTAAQDTTKDYFETLFRSFIGAMKGTGMMDDSGKITNPNIFAEVLPRCPEMGPVIASEFSRQTGYLVRRVTMRTRNSRNIPDDWELEQLKKFEDMAADGDTRTLLEVTKPDGVILPTREFEAFDVVTEGKGKDTELYFRYMRSITVPPLSSGLPCLKCHGSLNVEGELGLGVVGAIAAEYPHDMALGYKAGDIRGAWTIKIPLAEMPGR